jgi:hypothetical protein
MRRVADSLSVVDLKAIGSGDYEVCATERANYDEGTCELRLDLDSFVRRVNPHGRDMILRPSWLPHPEMLRHRVSMDDASADAKEVFEDWRRKLKHAIPAMDDFCQSIKASPAGGTGMPGELGYSAESAKLE